MLSPSLRFVERGSLVGTIDTNASSVGKRTHMVGVHLSASELAAWKAAAAQEGRVQLGRWTRETVNRALEGRRLPTVGVEERLEVLAGELGREGSNLNQAVKALNGLAAHGGDPLEISSALHVVMQAAQGVTATQQKVWAALGDLDEALS